MQHCVGSNAGRLGSIKKKGPVSNQICGQPTPGPKESCGLGAEPQMHSQQQVLWRTRGSLRPVPQKSLVTDKGSGGMWLAWELPITIDIEHCGHFLSYMAEVTARSQDAWPS